MDQDRHLGNTEEILHFAMELNRELDKHRDEKKPLREVHTPHVVELCLDEIEKRVKRIRKLNKILAHGTLEQQQEAQKQILKESKHIGNYDLMIFCKARLF